MSDSTPNDALARAIKHANRRRAERLRRSLIQGEAIPRITFHGLRHTGVTELLEGGVTLARVSQFARHKDQRVTASIYAHLSNAGLGEIADYWGQRSGR